MANIDLQYKKYLDKINNNYFVPDELEQFLFETKDEEWKKWIKYVYNSLYFSTFKREFTQKYNEIDIEGKEYKDFIDKFNNIKPNKMPKKEYKDMLKQITIVRDNYKKHIDKLAIFEENFDMSNVKINDNDINNTKIVFDNKLPRMVNKIEQKCEEKLNSYTTYNEKITNFCIVYGNLLYSDNHYKEWKKQNQNFDNNVESYSGIDILF
jgi:hypothetical protein